jgi:hypothetical protein
MRKTLIIARLVINFQDSWTGFYRKLGFVEILWKNKKSLFGAPAYCASGPRRLGIPQQCDSPKILINNPKKR